MRAAEDRSLRVRGRRLGGLQWDGDFNFGGEDLSWEAMVLPDFQ